MNRSIAVLFMIAAALYPLTDLQAATLTVGTCPGATHTDFQSAYNQLGTQNGPHTLRLCSGTHLTSPVSANYGHQNIVIESVSGSSTDTSLQSTGSTLMSIGSQPFTIRDLNVSGGIGIGGGSGPFRFDSVVVNGSITAGSAPLIFSNSEVNGDVGTAGAVSISGGSLTGDLNANNGVTSDNSDLSGSITATSGVINITGGTLDSQVYGGSQDLNLSGVNMTGGSLQVDGAVISIIDSQIGSSQQPVPIHANNGISVYDSLIWGELTAANWATIFLDPPTAVYGSCTPEATGGGFCGASECSDYLGQATINEVHAQGNAARFIEVRLLSGSIPQSVFSQWNLSFCSSQISPCQSVGLSSPTFDFSGYPWLILTKTGIPDKDYIDFGHGGGQGMEVRLDDANGDAIDYLSVDGYSSSLAATCPFEYDTTMGTTNSTTILRLPDGTGDWDLAGPGNSGDTTPGDSNDGSDPGFGYDHIRLTHPANALTCSPATITVEACADADCTAYHPDPVEVSFTSPAATWSPNPIVFTGSANVSLQYTTPGLVTLDAAPVDPDASNPTRCFSGGVETSCEMEFLESGFIIDVPDHVAATTVTGSIAAVKADPLDPVQCVPGFDNETKNVGFWFNYGNPSTGTLATSINGNPVGTTSPGTDLPITFDGNGVGTFSLEYPDVGEVELNARYQGSGDEGGLVMLGDNRFISRPAAFELAVSGNPGAIDSEGDVFIAAGVDFEIAVEALNATGSRTPNFGRESQPEGVDLITKLVKPDGGNDPDIAGTFGDFGLGCDGNPAAGGTACGEFSWPEVGIIELTPRLREVGGNRRYLATQEVIGTTVPHVGRFIPHHFHVNNGELVDRAALTDCTSDFTYIGERFDATFTVLARNLAEQVTHNYQADFAFLDPEMDVGDIVLGEVDGPALQVDAVRIDNWMMGSGDAVAQLGVERGTPDGPFEAYRVTAAPVDEDGVELLSPPAELTDDTDLYFGRLVTDNAIGSELGPVALPWRAEYWDGETWRVRQADNCTSLDLQDQVALSNDDDSGDGTESIVVGSGSSSITDESTLMLSDGTGRLVFSAPDAPGWIDVALLLDQSAADYPLPFLRDDLDDDGEYDDNPNARATFGLFDGNSQRIYIREIAPQ